MKKVETFKIVRDLLGGKWLVSDPERLYPIALDYLSRLPITIESSAKTIEAVLSTGVHIDDYSEDKTKEQEKVIILPLHGTMTKYETCTSDGTSALSNQIKSFADDNSVIGLVLDIDSGGGAASSVPPLIEAIQYFQSKSKPLIAHCDLCGSAAYWVASQCDAIYMDNNLSEVGSIGALSVLIDNTAPNPSTGERIITVYAKESEDKNRAYREAMEGKYTLLQDTLSPLVSEFQNAVTSKRPNLKKEKGILSGAMFMTHEALSLGLADARKTLAETVETVFALSEIS